MKMAMMGNIPSLELRSENQSNVRDQILAGIHVSGLMSIEELVKEHGSFRWADILRAVSQPCEEGIIQIENKGWCLRIFGNDSDRGSKKQAKLDRGNQELSELTLT